MVVLVLLMFACAFHEVFPSNTPLNATDYQKIIKTGFSTNYFKTLDFSKYKAPNIKDVYNRGFRNLRLRCRADLEGLNMTTFLTNLNTVVDKCLSKNIIPIISWIHHEGEAFANETHKQGFLSWWEQVAKKLKDKDYRLSFNLFTELGIDECNVQGVTCEQSLKENTTKYNEWTREVVKKIRGSGGNNEKRILILTSPKKTGEYLDLIAEDIYKNDSYMMAEWHIYASGPNKAYLNNGKKSVKYWEGTGDGVGKKNVDRNIEFGKNFTKTTGIPTYFAAWMANDNKKGQLNQSECINFAKYFVEKLKPIPWSINVLDLFYDTKKKKVPTATLR